jgi:hypothetical protein
VSMTNYVIRNYILCDKDLLGVIFKPLRYMQTDTLHNEKCGAQQKCLYCECVERKRNCDEDVVSNRSCENAVLTIATLLCPVVRDSFARRIWR